MSWLDKIAKTINIKIKVGLSHIIHIEVHKNTYYDISKKTTIININEHKELLGEILPKAVDSGYTLISKDADGIIEEEKRQRRCLTIKSF